MGIVYLASNRLNGQLVALKRVHAASSEFDSLSSAELDSATQVNSQGPGESVSIRTALAREFQLLASLHHPNIVGVLDYGFDKLQNPFFVMEVLESPQTIVEAGEDKSIKHKINLLVQLLQALVYLHRRNILHRDIKPSNVLVVNNQVKLVDFGIAEMADANPRLAGTLHYMAPEMYLGSPPSIESDLYAVGVVAFELMTRRLPHQSTSRTQFLGSLLGDSADDTLPPDILDMLSGFGGANAEAVNSDMDMLDLITSEPGQPAGEVGQVVKRLLARAPEDRYHDALHVIRDLSALIQEAMPAETSATRESFLQAAEFIGREEELEKLSRALTKAERKNGSVWLIAGESGVGKSRLAREVRINALVRSARVVRNQGVTERAANYSLWNPIVRALCLEVELEDSVVSSLKEIAPDIESLLQRTVPKQAGLPPQVVQARLHAAVATLLSMQQQLTVILLEDLQWAGSESLELLAYLSPLVQKMSVVIVGNYREDEATDELRALPAAHHMRLGRLQEKQIARLCESMLGEAGHNPELVKYLKRQTEGNVFFLVETVRALAEQAGELNRIGHQALPEEILTGGIERIIQRRLLQVPAEFSPLLDLAAVAGRRLDLALLERSSGRRDLAGFLMVCANAMVLEAQQGDWQFSHDKIREWIITQQTEAETRRLHQLVAETITALYPEDASHNAALGYHWDKADFPEKAYGYYMKAGAAAARLFAVIEARAHYSAALAILTRVTDSPEVRRQRVDTLFLVIGLSIQTANLPLFPARLEESAALLRPLLEREPVDPADAQRITRVEFWKGRCRLLMGEQDKAIDHCIKAGELATKYRIPDVYASACLLIGQCKFAQGYMAACWPHYLQALEWLEPRKPNPEWVRTVGYQGLSLVARGEIRSGLDHINRAIQSAKDPTLVLTTYAYLSYASTLMHDWVVARDNFLKVRELAEANNDLRFAAQAIWGAAWAEAELGNFSVSNTYRDQAHRFFTKDHLIIFHDWMTAADARSLQLEGRADEAMKVAEDAIALAQKFGGLFGQGLGHRILAQSLAQTDDPDWPLIMSHMKTCFDFFTQGEAWLEAAHTHAIFAKLLFQQGDTIQAAKHYTIAIEQYESFKLVPLLDDARSDLAQVVGS